MSDDNFRQERIERLLYELVHEIERGILDNEIGEELTFHHIMNFSRKIPGGVTVMRFITRPMTAGSYDPSQRKARLRVVK